jgi:asparagine synthetase B (glutamine-hydrolysing)
VIASPTKFNPTALSEFLALRWLADPTTAWFGEFRPAPPAYAPVNRTPVGTAQEIEQALLAAMGKIDLSTSGLLLSGGMDSAILARLLPPGIRTYTIRFDAPDATDESDTAATYARASKHRHTVVTVGWTDYEACADLLMRSKRAPLHPVEVGLYVAARAARADGVTTLIVGNGADSTFGGLDRLLSRDWTFDEFVRRYTFVDPSRVLCRPASVLHVFEPWRRGDRVDVVGFLRTVHGDGVTQAFMNAVNTADCEMRAPYEDLTLRAALDLDRIRKGASKYLLRDLFATLYPNWSMPDKIAFARPMDRWMEGWRGPSNAEFRPVLNCDALSGEQRWLVYSLDRFLTLIGDAE